MGQKKISNLHIVTDIKVTIIKTNSTPGCFRPTWCGGWRPPPLPGGWLPLTVDSGPTPNPPTLCTGSFIHRNLKVTRSPRVSSLVDVGSTSRGSSITSGGHCCPTSTGRSVGSYPRIPCTVVAMIIMRWNIEWKRKSVGEEDHDGLDDLLLLLNNL